MAAGPLSVEPRLEAMARRLEDTALHAGLAGDEAARIVASYLDVAARRASHFGDAEHFAVLHPARTALILMHDAGVRSTAVLVTACAVDAVRPALGATTGALAAKGEHDAAALLDEVMAVVSGAGSPDSDLLERLLACSDDARLVLLADRLDFVRHLHLEPDRDAAADHHETERVHLPAAGRTHPRLARRFARWTQRFAARLD